MLVKYRVGMAQSKMAITIVKEDSVQGVLDNLRYQLIKDRQISFDYVKRLSRDKSIETRKWVRLSDYKRAEKFFRKTGYKTIECENEKLKISLRKLGDVIGLSAATAHALVKKKIKEGFVRKIKNPPKRIFLGEFFGELPRKMIFSKGFLYSPICNNYVFS